MDKVLILIVVVVMVIATVFFAVEGKLQRQAEERQWEREHCVKTLNFTRDSRGNKTYIMKCDEERK